MSKAEFEGANVTTWDGNAVVSVSLRIRGKVVKITEIPASNELIKELTALFKRHLPKPEDI